MSADRLDDVFADISRSGYHPDIVSAGLRDALADEPVIAHVVHHEPTFDRDEIRRHLTVLALTPSRVLLVHTDEHPPDDIVLKPYTSTTAEAVSISQVRSVMVTRVVPVSGGGPAEAVLTVGWGAVSRLDLEPAQCGDPECEADHGYTGSVTGDDFSLRLSATADGGLAVERLLSFARELSAATTPRGGAHG